MAQFLFYSLFPIFYIQTIFSTHIGCVTIGDLFFFLTLQRNAKIVAPLFREERLKRLLACIGYFTSAECAIIASVIWQEEKKVRTAENSSQICDSCLLPNQKQIVAQDPRRYELFWYSRDYILFTFDTIAQDDYIIRHCRYLRWMIRIIIVIIITLLIIHLQLFNSTTR